MHVAIVMSLLACALPSLVLAEEAVGVTTVVATDGHVMTQTTSPAGTSPIPHLSADGRSSWVDDGKGGRVTYSYDAAGHVTQVAKSRPGEETIIYDAAGAVIKRLKVQPMVLSSDGAGRVQPTPVEQPTPTH